MDMNGHMLICLVISMEVGRRKEQNNTYYERSEAVSLGRSRYQQDIHANKHKTLFLLYRST